MLDRRLVKSSHDRKIAGVCGGLAEHFGIDPTLVRLGFVLLTVLSAATWILVYLALVIFLPKE